MSQNTDMELSTSTGEVIILKQIKNEVDNNEMKDIDFFDYDHESGEPSKETKHVSWPVSKTNGRIFAYLSIPFCIGAWLSGLTHTTIYISKGHEWRRNPTEYALGYNTNGDVKETEQTKVLINSHAIIGMIGVGLITFQVLSAIKFSTLSPNEPRRCNILRQAHGFVGRLLVLVLITVVATGSIFMIKSTRWNKTGIFPHWSLARFSAAIIGWWLGAAGVINALLGYKVITDKTRSCKDSTKLVEHKGYMYFTIFWLLMFSFSEVMMTILQLMMTHCGLGGIGQVFCIAFGQTVMLIVFLLSVYFRDEGLLLLRFVRVNVCFLMLHTIGVWISFVFLWVNPENVHEENSCFLLV